MTLIVTCCGGGCMSQGVGAGGRGGRVWRQVAWNKSEYNRKSVCIRTKCLF